MVKQSANQSFADSFDVPGQSRSFVSAMLAQWDRKLPSEDAQLVVTELVTNALQHAGGKIDVCLELDDESLRISVVDPEPQRLPTLGKPHGDGGYGLNIVSALSVAWGFESAYDTKTIWAEVDLGDH
jgi:anti-sigma regulatory factor (Ser/Thr protein kinase)